MPIAHTCSRTDELNRSSRSTLTHYANRCDLASGRCRVRQWWRTMAAATTPHTHMRLSSPLTVLVTCEIVIVVVVVLPLLP
jgi:hypothetical protein